jgi:hypothetical protein
MSRPKGSKNKRNLTHAVAAQFDWQTDQPMSERLAAVYENATLPDDVRLHALGLLAIELGLRVARPDLLRQPAPQEARP